MTFLSICTLGIIAIVLFADRYRRTWNRWDLAGSFAGWLLVTAAFVSLIT